MATATLEEMIDRIRQAQARWDLPMQPPCPEARLLALPAKVKRELGGTIPTRYLDLLRIADGISENALMVYASEDARDAASDVVGRELEIAGIVEANQFYRDQEDVYRDLILFAYREEYFWAQVIDTGEFIKICETDLDGPVRAHYQTFDEMMIAAIDSALVK